MNVFDLSAKINLDTSSYTQALGAAGAALSKTGKMVKAFAEISTAAIGAASTAVAAFTKSALNEYASYEQLVGGVQTLFGSASDKVIENAEKAYATAGISANEYMETVTSFSASLIQATGRGAQQDIDVLQDALDEEYAATKRTLQDEYDETKDYWNKKIKLTTDKNQKAKLQEQRDEELKALKRSNEDTLLELKAANKQRIAEAEKANNASTTTAESLERAAELADQAIIDMSDNANKMGSSMESIQNAYQGFAKQNYTMLDNLKLGYGGTESEMERLLKTANELNEKQGIYTDYQIENYADIVEAIHVVQSEMGITNTTAKEAAGTIQGSAGSMKAAWDNLIVELGKGGDAIKALQASGVEWDKYADKAWAAGGAVEGVVEDIQYNLKRISEGEESLEGLQEYLQFEYDMDASDAIKAIEAVKNTTSNAQAAISSFTESLEMVLSNTIPRVEVILTNIGATIEQLGPVIAKKLPELIEATLPSLLSAGTSLVKSLGNALIASVPVITPMITDLMKSIGNSIIVNAPMVIEDFAQMFRNASGKLSKSLPGIVKFGTQVITSIISGISKNLPMILKSTTEIIGSLVQGITESLPLLLDAVTGIIAAMGQGIVDNLPALVESALLIIESLAEYLTEALPELIPAAVSMVVEIAKTLTEPENIQRIVSCAVDLILALVDGLLDALPILIEALPEIITNLVEGLTSEESIGKIIDGMIEIVGKLAEWLLDPENLAMLVVAAGQIIWALIKGMVNIQVEIWETLGSILAECGRTVYEYGEKAFNWGKELIQSIIDGIKSMAGEISDAISDVIPDGVKDFISGGKDLIGKGASKLSGLFHAEGGVTAHATGGYLINSPVLTTGGDLFGEAGREAILPLDTNTEWMDKLAERINSNNVAPVVIQEVNINFPEGLTIGSDYDTDRMIERISEQLSNLQMAQTAAIGGANW